MSSSQEAPVRIENIRSLLQKCLGCKGLEIVDHSATNLLPPGENYCSTMVKLNVLVRRDKAANEETLNLVAKTLHRTERPIIDWFQVFKKEVFMYVELIPAYKRLEREMGIEPVFDALPKYVGHRCSLHDRDDLLDEHSLLLMENLKASNYYTCDRHAGVDFEHARLALSSLARYHALGIALKQKQPDFFKQIVSQAKVIGVDNEQIDEGFDAALKIYRETRSVAKHLAKIEESFARVKNGGVWTQPGAEPWLGITHGDFWINNMLFRRDDEDRVVDVKFVDFHMYLHCSPLKDLPYFLCGSTDEDARTNRLDDLLNLYYGAFVKSLERLGCDAGPFSRESFDRDLKQQAIAELPLIALAIKFFIFEVDQGQNESKVIDVIHSKSNDAYVKKLQQLISTYEKRGWF